MPQKRMYVDGAVYFVTARTFQHQKIFNQDGACLLLLSILDSCRKMMKFRLYAYVVMPDHVHLLILPRGKYDISDINHRVKGNFAIQHLRNHKGSVAGTGDRRVNFQNSITGTRDSRVGYQGSVAEIGFADLNRKSELLSTNHASEPLWFAREKRRRIRVNPIWQKSFYDRIIRSDRQMYNTINYINYNAVHHHLIDDPLDWPYTSFHNYDETGKALIKIDYWEG